MHPYPPVRGLSPNMIGHIFWLAAAGSLPRKLIHASTLEALLRRNLVIVECDTIALSHTGLTAVTYIRSNTRALSHNL